MLSSHSEQLRPQRSDLYNSPGRKTCHPPNGGRAKQDVKAKREMHQADSREIIMVTNKQGSGQSPAGNEAERTEGASKWSRAWKMQQLRGRQRGDGEAARQSAGWMHDAH